MASSSQVRALKTAKNTCCSHSYGGLIPQINHPCRDKQLPQTTLKLNRTEVLMKSLCLTQQLDHGNYNLHSFPVPKFKLKLVKKIRDFSDLLLHRHLRNYLHPQGNPLTGGQIKGEVIYFGRQVFAVSLRASHRRLVTCLLFFL